MAIGTRVLKSAAGHGTHVKAATTSTRGLLRVEQ